MSVVSIAIVLMSSNIVLSQVTTDYLTVYLWDSINKERYADARIRIYEGSQPSIVGGEQAWRNLLFDTDIEIGPGIPTSHVSWYGAKSNGTYTIRAISDRWGGEVIKVVTGGGDVELFFDSATEPSEIPEILPEVTPATTPTPEPNSESEVEADSTETLLILVIAAIAVVIIVVIVAVYRRAKKKNLESQQTSG